MKNKYLLKIIRIVVSVFLLSIILCNINLSEFASLWGKIDYFLLILPLYIIVGIVISSYKLKLIFNDYKINISLYQTIKLYWSGSYINLLLPTSFGGDIYKYHYVNKNVVKNKRAQVLSSLILERGIGLISSIYFALIFYTIFSSIAIVYKLIFAILILLSVLFFEALRREKIEFNLEKKESFLTKAKKTIQILLNFNNKKVLLISVIISLLFTFICVMATYTSFLAIGIKPDFWFFMFLVPVINLSKLFPFAINSLGVKEGVSLILFSQYGILPEVILSAVIISRLVNTAVGAFGIFPYLSMKRK